MITKFSNGVEIINCTPHEIRFKDGEEVITVVPSGYKINASTKENIVSEIPCKLVTTSFISSADGLKEIEEIKAKYPHALIVGSIISAQAYPGEVVGMTSAHGFERVAPSEKLMAIDKFTIFGS